ncbi:alpha/beta hydrolase [Paenibacillus sp. TAB 01]|uniref:alpha/beta hydrolase n=1 Tax=Paenibacillus sp. TAB 01 TaxID=3368988 RepID=UPI00375114C6
MTPELEQTLFAGSKKEWQPFGIPGAKQFDIHSKSGRAYRIFVYVPLSEPPAAGFPVFYLLDANAVFATAVEAVRVQGRRPEKTGVSPAVVVGIGYPADMPFVPDRFYDFTLPVPASELPVHPDGIEWPVQGGAEAFLSFIEKELKPVIESRCSIDTSRQAIMGHSLGGLFVLHALFSKPEAFSTYIAGSPSIHWNKRALLEEERQFTARMQLEIRQLGILLAAGQLEQGHERRMTESAFEMAERLSSLSDRGIRAEYKEFEGEGHVSVLPGLISRALRFFLS